MLLDTHVLVWLALGDKTLGKKTRALLDTALHASESLSVSAISYWEIGMLTDKGRLNLDSVLTRRASIQMGISEVVVDGTIAIQASVLAAFHGDPADRLIVASALALGVPLVTADRAILKWNHIRSIDATR
jgi:PIN domain nuclease of toxin-antitoxin system